MTTSPTEHVTTEHVTTEHVTTEHVAIGVDVGQKRDPTAIAVVALERRRRRALDEDHHVARFLERLPLGTSYPAIAQRVAAVCAGVRQKTGVAPACYVDATGVGTPLLDLLVAELARNGQTGRAAPDATVIGCYFTHGDRRTERLDPSGAVAVSVTIGKAWLVSRLQALLQSDRLHLPQTGEARVLAKELQDYEIRVSEQANDTYGAFKVGTHDDLVTALGLAVQPLRPAWDWGRAG